MKKTKITAIMIMCAIVASAAVGCGSLSSDKKVSSTLGSDEAPESTDAPVSENEQQESGSTGSENLGSIEALDSAAGFTVEDLGVDGYVANSYSFSNGVAQITYSHDGNTAVLRVSKDTSSPIAQVTGTGSVEDLTITDGVQTSIQQNDTTYIAEWTGVNKQGFKREYSFTEDGVQQETFSNTVLTYAQSVLAEDQSDTSEENGEGETTSIQSLENGTGEWTDNLKTYAFQVTESGTYKFEDNASGNDVYWDIYVLDSPWDGTDTAKTLPQTETTAGQTPTTIQINSGQYVYCICNKNQFTSGEAETCKLQVSKVDETDSGSASTTTEAATTVAQDAVEDNNAAGGDNSYDAGNGADGGYGDDANADGGDAAGDGSYQ